MSAWRKLGIIAGGGDLPVAIAEQCQADGKAYFVARIAPYAHPALDRHPGATHGLGAMGARIAALKQAGCDAIVIVGQVPRPDLSKLEFDDGGRAMAPALMAAAPQGDDALLRAVLEAHAQAGFAVIGVQTAIAELLAPAGVLGALEPDAGARADMARGAEVVAALGALDIGQGAVVCDGLVLAVEAQEGTDAMLARVATLPEAVRGAPERRRGVLAKRPKPIQDRRVDLPVIGVATIEGAAAAGLAGVAVEAGAALIVRRREVIAAADRAGLFLYGFTREET